MRLRENGETSENQSSNVGTYSEARTWPEQERAKCQDEPLPHSLAG